jgi:hypothetical protein
MRWALLMTPFELMMPFSSMREARSVPPEGAAYHVRLDQNAFAGMSA